MNHEEKIKTLAELRQIVADLKREGKKIVHCHGIFDFLTPECMSHLAYSKKQGDVLIVSITADKYATRGVANFPDKFRASTLAGTMFVDYIIIDSNFTAIPILTDLKPDVYVKGKEYENSKNTGLQGEIRIVNSYNGKILFSPHRVVISPQMDFLTHRIPDDQYKFQK